MHSSFFVTRLNLVNCWISDVTFATVSCIHTVVKKKSTSLWYVFNKSLQCPFIHQCRSTEISMSLWAARILFCNTTDKVPCNETYGKVCFVICFVCKVHGNCNETYCKVHGNFHVPCFMFHRKVPMEISMYLAIKHKAKYMAISMYLAICFIARCMEISMYLAKANVSLQGTWKVPCTLPKVCMWGKLLARYVEISMFPAGFAFHMRYLWKKSCSLR